MKKEQEIKKRAEEKLRPFNNYGSIEWRANQLKGMLKIRNSENSIKSLSEYAGRHVGESHLNYNRDLTTKKVNMKLAIDAIELAEKIVDYIVEVYTLKQPLFPKKYILTPEDFEKNIRKYFDILISENLELGYEIIERKYKLLKNLDDINETNRNGNNS